MAKVSLNDNSKQLKVKSRNPVIEFDRLQMYCGEPYVIDLEDTEGSITIYSPTMGTIIRKGESKFYTTLNIFVTNTTSYRLPLWDAGVNWNDLSDFELFVMLCHGIDKDISNMMFGDLDFDKFQPCQKGESLILYDAEDNIEINENVYFHISQYLRNVFNIFPEEKITQDKTLQNWYVNKDRRQKAIDEEKDEKPNSSIQSIVSACVNHPGFKYNLNELMDIGVCQFYDSVKRLQLYESTTALMKGMYSGFVDGSKIHSDDYNFMKDI